MKNKWQSMGISGVLFGTILSRWATSHYGENARLVIIWSMFLILLIYSLFVAYKTKKYLIAMTIPIVFMPLLITPKGSALRQIYVETGQLVVFFILLILMVKVVIPWLEKRK